MPSWSSALFFALGALLALEVPLLLISGQLRSLRGRLLYQLWAFHVASVVFFVLADRIGEWPRAWRGLAVVTITLSALLAYRLVAHFLLGGREGGHGRRAAIPKLVRDVLGWVVFATALAASLAAFGVTKPTALLVSSTVLSAVAGFALQDVLKNLIAAMALQTERAFATGDWLLLDGRPVQVVDMSWRTTHLRDNEGRDHFEPNASLVNQRLVSLGSGERPVAWSFPVGLPYVAPPQQVKAALLAAARGAPGAVESPEPAAFVDSFGDSAIVYRLRVWTRDVHRLVRFADGVQSRIWYQLQRAGLEVPFPVRTVELHDAAAMRAERGGAELARRLARLAGLELFAPLAPGQREQLAGSARRLHFDDGERLVREGDPGDSLFIVDRGRVVVSKGGSASGESSSLLLATLGEGELFGEMSLLTGEARSATVASSGGCEVLVLDREAIAPLLAADPTLAETLSGILADRVAATAARVEGRRDRQASVPEGSDAGSLLRRIRSLFGLDRR